MSGASYQIPPHEIHAVLNALWAGTASIEQQVLAAKMLTAREAEKPTDELIFSEREACARIAEQAQHACALNTVVYAPPMKGANSHLLAVHAAGEATAYAIASAIRARGTRHDAGTVQR